MLRNVSLDDPIDVFISPLAYPHVLHTTRPLGLREDHQKAYQTLKTAIRNNTMSLDDVRAWFLAAAQVGAITHLRAFQGGERFVFPLLLSLKSVRLPTMGADELRLVEVTSLTGSCSARPLVPTRVRLT